MNKFCITASQHHSITAKNNVSTLKYTKFKSLKHYFLNSFFIFFLVILASSCNKDTDMSDTVLPENMYESIQERQDQIIEFLGIVTQKDGNVTSRTSSFNLQTNEAVPFLEESLNLGFCRLDSSFYEQYFYAYDTIFIPVSNDSISSAVLADAFDSIAHFAAIEYGNRPSSTRKSILFGLYSDYVVDTTRNDILVACLYVVAENIGVAYSSGNYDVDDYWYYCCGFGKCGPYSGGEPNDAAKILTKDLKEALVPSLLNLAYYFIEPYSICFSPGNGCWDGVNHIEIDEYINDEHSMWWNTSDCMDPTDLGFHFSSMKEMIKDNQPYTSNPPSLKSVVSLFVYDDLIGSTKLHSCAVTYGTLIELKTEAPTPLNLADF